MNRSPERGDVAPRLRRRFPKRLRRLELLFSSVRPFYFITFNTHARLRLLACEEIHRVFRSFGAGAENHDIAVGRYVIMPDHVHLFVAFPMTGLTLSEWIGALKTVLGKELLSLGMQKPHWQEGFFDHAAERGELLAEMEVCPDESGTSGALQSGRGLALSGRNRKHRVLVADGTSTERRGYSGQLDNTGNAVAASLCRGAGVRVTTATAALVAPLRASAGASAE